MENMQRDKNKITGKLVKTQSGAGDIALWFREHTVPTEARVQLPSPNLGNSQLPVVPASVGSDAHF